MRTRSLVATPASMAAGGTHRDSTWKRTCTYPHRRSTTAMKQFAFKVCTPTLQQQQQQHMHTKTGFKLTSNSDRKHQNDQRVREIKSCGMYVCIYIYHNLNQPYGPACLRQERFHQSRPQTSSGHPAMCRGGKPFDIGKPWIS